MTVLHGGGFAPESVIVANSFLSVDLSATQRFVDRRILKVSSDIHNAILI